MGFISSVSYSVLDDDVGAHEPRDRSLAIPSARLKQCSRGYDSSSTHNPEPLEERGGGNGPETRPEAKPS